MMRSFALVAVALAAGAGRADPITAETATAVGHRPATDVGIALTAGAGVTNFTSSVMNDAVDVGGTWDLRVTVGTRLLLGAELGYAGTRRNLNVAHLAGISGDSPHLFSNAIEAVARVQYPWVTGNWLLEPFAFGGVGYTHVGVDAIMAPGSLLSTSDDLFVMPFGGGVSASWNGIVVEGRFTYRATYEEDLLRNANGTIASLNNWSAGAVIGYEF